MLQIYTTPSPPIPIAGMQRERETKRRKRRGKLRQDRTTRGKNDRESAGCTGRSVQSGAG